DRTGTLGEIETLKMSRARQVYVIGRRGLFEAKEFREILQLTKIFLPWNWCSQHFRSTSKASDGSAGEENQGNKSLTSIELRINRLEGELSDRRAVAAGEKETLNADCIEYKSVGIQRSRVSHLMSKEIVPNVDSKFIDAD
ncbi:hypothetical protein BGZ65_004629, partial [Modicella reniformis]